MTTEKPIAMGDLSTLRCAIADTIAAHTQRGGCTEPVALSEDEMDEVMRAVVASRIPFGRWCASHGLETHARSADLYEDLIAAIVAQNQ